MRKIYLNEIRDSRLLNSDSLDYIKKWMKRNNIEIHHDENKGFVNYMLFETAYEESMINELKRKYKSDWETVYQLHTKNDKDGFLNFKQTKKQPTFSEKYNTGYNPESKQARELRNYLNNNN